MAWRLKRIKQCDKCPWKKSTNPCDIPDGYTVQAHKALKSTIAVEGEINLNKQLHIMSCHEHAIGEETHCIGWLDNQLNTGNNILLRLSTMNCENVYHIHTVGAQHKTFKDTLPTVKKKVNINNG